MNLPNCLLIEQRFQNISIFLQGFQYPNAPVPGIGIAVTEHIVFLAVVNNVKAGSRFARAFGPVSCCIRQGEGYLAILIQRGPGGQIGSGSRFTGSVGNLLFSGTLGEVVLPFEAVSVVYFCCEIHNILLK